MNIVSLFAFKADYAMMENTLIVNAL